MIRLALAALLAALAATGCKSDPPPEPAAPPKPATPPDTPVTPPKPVPDTIPTPTVDAEAAQALVDRWLAAQNAGDFAAYEATYAPRFFGIKRAGPRTARFDRAGWMKDRRRMFQQPMTVSAADVRVTPGPGTARVVFTQTWSSGDFTDTGPKQLVLDLVDGRPLITREEMLQSTVLGPAPRAADDLGVHHVRVLDAPYVVLGPPVPTDAAPELITRGRPFAVKARAPDDPSKIGQPVALYGPNGRRCTGRIAELVVLGLVIPHFGAVQTWDGTMTPDGRKVGDPQIARELWQMSDGGGRVLAGRLDRDPADCAGAVYARIEPAEAPAPPVWRPRIATPAERNAALEALRRTDEHRELQRQFTAQVEGAEGPWDAAADTRASAQVYTPPEGAPLLVVNLDAGLGCGEFGGGVWQAFTLGDTLTPVGPPRTTPFTAAAALDVGGPVPALIGTEGYSTDSAVFAPTPEGYAPRSALSILDLDCPC